MRSFQKIGDFTIPSLVTKIVLYFLVWPFSAALVTIVICELMHVLVGWPDPWQEFDFRSYPIESIKWFFLFGPASVAKYMLPFCLLQVWLLNSFLKSSAGTKPLIPHSVSISLAVGLIQAIFLALYFGSSTTWLRIFFISGAAAVLASVAYGISLTRLLGVRSPLQAGP